MHRESISIDGVQARPTSSKPDRHLRCQEVRRGQERDSQGPPYGILEKIPRVNESFRYNSPL